MSEQWERAGGYTEGELGSVLLDLESFLELQCCGEDLMISSE